LPAHFKEKFRVCSAFPYNKKLYNINLNILFNLNQFLDDNGRCITAVCGFMSSSTITTTTTVTSKFTTILPTDFDLTNKIKTETTTQFSIKVTTETIEIDFSTDSTTEIDLAVETTTEIDFSTKSTTEFDLTTNFNLTAETTTEFYKLQYISAEIGLSVVFGFLCFVLLSIYLVFKKFKRVRTDTPNVENGIEMISLNSPLMKADISVTLNSKTLKVERVDTKYNVSNV